MKKKFPSKLKKGDTVALIAPSTSLAYFSRKRIALSIKLLEQIGLHVQPAKHVCEINSFDSSSIYCIL